MRKTIMLGKFIFLYKTDLTFMFEMVIMISQDDYMCIIQMICWICKLESMEKATVVTWESYFPRNILVQENLG
jgi:hypothetical protein